MGFTFGFQHFNFAKDCGRTCSSPLIIESLNDKKQPGVWTRGLVSTCAGVLVCGGSVPGAAVSLAQNCSLTVCEAAAAGVSVTRTCT